MKTFSLTIGLALAALALAGCPGNATNTTTNGGANAGRGNAVLNTNTNTAPMNSNTANSNMMNSNMTNSNANAAAAMDTTPSGFMTAAATSGNNEIAAARMALTKTKNAEVKQYAEQMIADHTKAANELKKYAGEEKVTLPTEPDAAHKATADTMSKLSGDDFDREYLKGQVADHEKAVALFEAESTGGTDSDLKAFAAKTLPTLKMHLDMAQKLNAKMK